MVNKNRPYWPFKTHYNVGAKVRKTIKELGGTMPEDLPTPKKSLKQLEKENNKSLKKQNKWGNTRFLSKIVVDFF